MKVGNKLAFEILTAPMSPHSNKDKKPLTIEEVAKKYKVSTELVKKIRKI